MNHFFRHLGKVVVGCIAVLAVLLWVLILIGFFVNGAPKVFLETMGKFFAIVSIVAVAFSIPAWRWRKEIWDDVLSMNMPSF